MLPLCYVGALDITQGRVGVDDALRHQVLEGQDVVGELAVL